MDMNKANRDKLKALEREQLRMKYPSMRDELIPLTDWKDNSANNLTKCIIFFIKAMDGQAERISNQGQYRAGKSIEIASGMKQLPGKWTPGTGTKGTADISATIRGRSVKIEVKYGKDRQSDAQKQYQADVERAGGTYYIARDFDSFVLWYEKFSLHL
jgi:hypothetical protein